VRTALSRKANPSCTCQYLSFVHPELFLLWDPCRIFYSLNSFGFIASVEAAAKEKTRFVPAAKTD